MKVCIVTVYDSINCGSFWQAFAMGEFLKRCGHSVCYLERRKTDGASSSHKAQVKKGISVFIKHGPCAIVRYLGQIREYKRCLEAFSIIKERDKENIDCFILGSDTIWNWDSRYFYNNYEVYFGKILFPKRVITYAVSVANTSIEKFESVDELEHLICQMSTISVRDSYTQSIVREISGKNAEIVCDPTMLLSKEDYSRYIQVHPKRKYIFLYLFSRLSTMWAEEIRALCKEQGFEVVSGAFPHKPYYADKVAGVTPFDFLECMMFAEYIITDTFHGCVFSVNLQKQFVAINKGKNKVNEFLVEMGFTDRLISDGESISEKLKNEIDYKTRTDRVDEIKRQSVNFLNDTLEGKS